MPNGPFTRYPGTQRVTTFCKVTPLFDFNSVDPQNLPKVEAMILDWIFWLFSMVAQLLVYKILWQLYEKSWDENRSEHVGFENYVKN
jgi:hypothetical protein